MSLVPNKPESVLAPGYRLDRYELLCLIAEGGMGACWLARLRGKHGFEKLVAIKTLKAEYAGDPAFQRMFLDEARIASRIEHTNVAQILDLGEYEGVLYLAMEFVEGDSLSKVYREVTKTTKLPIGIVSRILADTCGGLHAAHELCDEQGTPLGVVHRDVSPQNIMISTKGSAKLIDFGIARARDRSAGNTNTGELRGKIRYMAPEQANGQNLDRRGDVYAVGAVLYHLLSGRSPYEADSQVATLTLLLSGRPPLPLPPGIPKAIANVTMRALAHRQDDRFATCDEMRLALEEAMREERIETTTIDVAAFIATHLAQRAAMRRETIKIALDRVGRGDLFIKTPVSISTDGGTTVTVDTEKIFTPPSPHDGKIASGSDASLGSSSSTIAQSTMEALSYLSPLRRGALITLAGAVVTLLVIGFGWIALFRKETPTASGSSNQPPSLADPQVGAAGEPAALPSSAASATTETSTREAPTSTTSTTASPSAGAMTRPNTRVGAGTTTPTQKRRHNVDDGF